MSADTLKRDERTVDMLRNAVEFPEQNAEFVHNVAESFAHAIQENKGQRVSEVFEAMTKTWPESVRNVFKNLMLEHSEKSKYEPLI